MYFGFQDIFRNQSVDINLRLMAILLLKNGVEKYWRPNAPKYVKAFIIIILFVEFSYSREINDTTCIEQLFN